MVVMVGVTRQARRCCANATISKPAKPAKPALPCRSKLAGRRFNHLALRPTGVGNTGRCPGSNLGGKGSGIHNWGKSATILL